PSSPTRRQRSATNQRASASRSAARPWKAATAGASPQSCQRPPAGAGAAPPTRSRASASRPANQIGSKASLEPGRLGQRRRPQRGRLLGLVAALEGAEGEVERDQAAQARCARVAEARPPGLDGALAPPRADRQLALGRAHPPPHPQQKVPETGEIGIRGSA